jgi:hypothetical protein
MRKDNILQIMSKVVASSGILRNLVEIVANRGVGTSTPASYKMWLHMARHSWNHMLFSDTRPNCIVVTVKYPAQEQNCVFL